ncbi:fluoride efflux transporter FluC [Nesterenkonia lutea]|uniref:Fluoride-specific ion channel FluC n=1 Tax=Nesterenkonia lutea TaxID=272919 RepID=A0ABR9JEA8_9MICC|nr:CrcB family protein [Nesterenkonia lutea]MBE1524273.1 CrcB protein [Nesterenkonia lutea]
MISELNLLVVVGVAAGGALGAVLRFLLDRYLRGGLLVANTLACLALGYLYGELSWLAENGGPGADSLLSASVSTILALGVLGALSTFATVSVRVAQRWMAGHRLRAAGIWAAHVGLGFAAAAVGIALSQLSGLY